MRRCPEARVSIHSITSDRHAAQRRYDVQMKSKPRAYSGVNVVEHLRQAKASKQGLAAPVPPRSVVLDSEVIGSIPVCVVLSFTGDMVQIVCMRCLALEKQRLPAEFACRECRFQTLCANCDRFLHKPARFEDRPSVLVPSSHRLL
jgi:hypothetical protein